MFDKQNSTINTLSESIK